MIRVDVGEILIKQKVNGFFSDKYTVFKLIPSFENISKIGDSEQLIDIYSTLINNRHMQLLQSFNKSMNKIVTKEIKTHIRQQENFASLVIACCCNKDASKLTLKPDTKISIAISLLKYGVSGHANIRVSQRNAIKQYQPTFDINQYISNARVHLGLSLNDAKMLTMTEYITLMSNKYPDNDGLTQEEYDKASNNYLKEREKRRSKLQS